MRTGGVGFEGGDMSMGMGMGVRWESSTSPRQFAISLSLTGVFTSNHSFRNLPFLSIPRSPLIHFAARDICLDSPYTTGSGNTQRFIPRRLRKPSDDGRGGLSPWMRGEG